MIRLLRRGSATDSQTRNAYLGWSHSIRDLFLQFLRPSDYSKKHDGLNSTVSQEVIMDGGGNCGEPHFASEEAPSKLLTAATGVGVEIYPEVAEPRIVSGFAMDSVEESERLLTEDAESIKPNEAVDLERLPTEDVETIKPVEVEESERLLTEDAETIKPNEAGELERSLTEDVKIIKPVEVEEPEQVLLSVEPSSRLITAEIDPEIFEVFMEEANEVLEVIQTQYPKWRTNISDDKTLETVRRSFHTLKGSGRIADAHVISEVSWALENLLNRIVDRSVPPDAQVLGYLDEAVAAMPLLIQAQTEGVAPDLNVNNLEKRAFELAEMVSREPSDEAEGALENVDSLFSDSKSGPQINLAEDLFEIFRTEMLTHLAVVCDFLRGCDGCQVSDDLMRAVHTLQGSSHVAQVEPMAILAGEMEVFCNHLHQLSQSFDDHSLKLMRVFHDTMQQMLDAINQPGATVPDLQSLVKKIRDADQILSDEISKLQVPTKSELRSESESKQETINVFMEEAAQLLEQIDKDLEVWEESADAATSLQRDFRTLKWGARLVGLVSVRDLADGLESFFGALEGAGEVDQDTQGKVGNLTKQIEDALDLLHLNGTLPDLGVQVDEVNQLTEGMVQLQSESIDQGQSRHRESKEQEPTSYLRTHSPPIGSEPHSRHFGEASKLSDTAPELNPEILEIFLEEADDLADQLERDFSHWEQDLSVLDRVDGLMRSLHTLKGGFRIVGLFDLGDLSHAMESLLGSLSSSQVVAEGSLIPVMRQGIDGLVSNIDQLRYSGTVSEVASITSVIEAAMGDVVVEESPEEAGWPDTETTHSLSQSTDQSSQTELEQDSLFTKGQEWLSDVGLLGGEVPALQEDKVMPTLTGDVQESLERERPPPLQAERDQDVKGEWVRVQARLLNQLVNGAGEVSIYRDRLERQSNLMQFNLKEHSTTITRLRTQLRALEMEAESQIRSHHELEDQRYGKFDPLEMDRYSKLQQLSRSLSETVSDLSNISDALGEQTRDTDSLLLQQARITTDLQDGLLRSRMVSFSHQISRLQRVTRQTAQTQGKKVELQVQGADGEIDRTVLNRIMGPLEHMLRNAVAHGIESPEKRLEHNKPETGKVSLLLAREAREIVLTISDDGVGLNVETIRQKAVQMGLLEPDNQLDENDYYQFILQPGFTTASEVTQVVGRGVGMDAVASAIKQLGGTLEILSQRGSGSCFIIRLPFTLAVSEVLLVRVQDNVYAIPHGSAEAITQISRKDLLTCYREGSDGFGFGNHRYQVHYLGATLGLSEPVLPENTKWFPLLLVNMGEKRIALQMDQILGNDQLVVKSIGAQLSGVRWFTGGSILADGTIVLLLDLNEVIRSTVASQPALRQPPKKKALGNLVMVVDDSITVRKVTSRLLVRHSMEVITAKDGVDAITILQDHRPDVMLLDIEMPRMDGYELARHIRNTPELADIPIIMITSRVGEKHRQRAFELGVNRYIGKPYKEMELLENISAVLAEKINE